jgi:hypothetical protein
MTKKRRINVNAAFFLIYIKVEYHLRFSELSNLRWINVSLNHRRKVAPS